MLVAFCTCNAGSAEFLQAEGFDAFSVLRVGGPESQCQPSQMLLAVWKMTESLQTDRIGLLCKGAGPSAAGVFSKSSSRQRL